MTDLEQLDHAKWVFERNLGWIAAAEVKSGVILTIDLAMLGALAAAIGMVDRGELGGWAILCTLVAFLILGFSVVCVGMAVFPRLKGPPKSLMFFSKIAEYRDVRDFMSDFSERAARDHLNDCLSQVHRNAEIANVKFSHVKSAAQWSFGAIVPWLLALLLLLANGHSP